MEYFFKSCNQAIEHTVKTKKFGVYYSESQNPDTSIHVHDCCEILLCLSGGKNFLINDKIYEVNNGDLFIINQYEAHKITFDENMIFARFVLEVYPEFIYQHSTVDTDLSRCFYIRGNGVSHRITLSDEQISELYGRFLKVKANSGYGGDISSTYNVLEALIFINKLFGEQVNTGKLDYYDDKTVRMVMEYINLNYGKCGNELSLDAISRYAYVSVNQLCRLFKKHCGTTISKYILSKRISEAKQLLLSGKSVTETALLCGFGDYANFIRVFKKSMGVSPGKYSNEHSYNKQITE